MATITTRAGKGSPLTNTEVDNNFTNLNTDKLEISGGTMTGNLDVGGSVTADGLTVETSTGVVLTGTGTGAPHTATRGTAALGASRSVFTFGANSTGDVTNGFGPALQFNISDTGVSNSEIGAIGFIRDGSDSLGKFVIANGANNLNSAASQFMATGPSGGTVFNGGGAAAYDFRVASDTNDHMLFVDAGSNHVNIGTSTDLGGLLNLNSGDGSFIVMRGTSNNTGYLNWESNGFTFYTNGPAEAFRIGSSEMVVNEDGRDYNFRVESDTKTHMFFIDASSNKVGIGASSPQTILEILDSNPILRMEDSAVGSKRIEIGVGSDSVAFVNAPQSAQTLKNSITGTESLTQYHNTNGVVVNEGGADRDFRVESDTNTHMLFVDAGSNEVGIGTSNPDATMHVYGSLTVGKSGVSEDYDLKMWPATAGRSAMGFRNQDNYMALMSGNPLSTELLTVTTGGRGVFFGGLTVNESGGSAEDFRVESDSVTNMFFVDASTNRIGINTNVPTTDVDIVGQGANFADIKLRDAAGRVLEIKSPSDSSEATIATTTNHNLEIHAGAGGATNYITFKTDTVERLEISSSSVIFNDTGADTDFRIESNDSATMFSLDGANNSILVCDDGSYAGISGRILTIASDSVANTGTVAGPAFIQFRDTDSVSSSTGDTTNAYAGIEFYSSDTSSAGPGIQASIKAIYDDTYMASSRLQFEAGAANDTYRVLDIIAGEVVVNEGSNNVTDFRVESDTQSHMLFVDAGNNVVSIAQATPVAKWLQIGGDAITTNKPSVSINAADDSGINTSLLIRGGSPTIAFDQTSGGAGRILMDDSKVRFYTGTLDSTGTEVFTVGQGSGSETVANEGSIDIDFRVESDSNANMLFVDAANDRVGIANGSPYYRFDQIGTLALRNGSIMLGRDAGTTTGGIHFYNPNGHTNQLRIYEDPGLWGGTSGANNTQIQIYGGAAYNLLLDGASGVSFDAGSNYLDDYEEGSHTYTVVGSTSGSWTPRPGWTQMAYTKIGRLVTVTGQIEVLGSSSPNGEVRISLPFYIASTNAQFSGRVAIGLRGRTSATDGIILLDATNANNYLRIMQLTDAGVVSFLGSSNGMDASWEFNFTMTYMTT